MEVNHHTVVNMTCSVCDYCVFGSNSKSTIKCKKKKKKNEEDNEHITASL